MSFPGFEFDNLKLFGN